MALFGRKKKNRGGDCGPACQLDLQLKSQQAQQGSPGSVPVESTPIKSGSSKKPFWEYLLGPLGGAAYGGLKHGGKGALEGLKGPFADYTGEGNALTDFFMGRDPSTLKIKKFEPWQEEIFKMLGQQGMQNFDFGPIEEQARHQFDTQTIPSLTQRFAGLGGTPRSSAFQGAIGAAGSNLNRDLASLRSGHGLRQLQFGLTPQFEPAYQPGSKGFLQEAIPAALRAYFSGGGMGF